MKRTFGARLFLCHLHHMLLRDWLRCLSVLLPDQFLGNRQERTEELQTVQCQRLELCKEGGGDPAPPAGASMEGGQKEPGGASSEGQWSTGIRVIAFLAG